MNNGNLKIPYGVSDFKRLRSEGFYFVDKSAYIRTLELCGSFLFFVRPRRFGKSLFLNMLRCYYDLAEKDNFDALFGDLDIGKDPTENRNRYQVLTLDFSQVNKGKGDTLEERFENYVGDRLDEFMLRYGELYEDDFRAAFASAKPASKFTKLTGRAQTKGYHLYLMLDEYDNFTNAMLRAEGNDNYRSITHGQGFYREWFKSFKGNFDRIFMTGVSPVTMDDLTSGFNIASNVSQSPLCNSMVGFSEAEVLKLYTDFKGTGRFTDGEPAEIVRAIKPWYDGYCFARKKCGQESVFNSDMSLYYLNALVQTGDPPEDWVDRNIATDYDKLETIAEIQRRMDPERAENVMSPIETLAAEGEICFPLKESFDAGAIREPDNFLSLYYYYGIITMKGRREGADWFQIPNVCVKRQMFDYLRRHYERARSPSWQEWASLARMFAYRGEWRPFLERLASDFADTTPVRGGIRGEHRIQGYMQAEFGHLDFYLLAPEMGLSRGFCDFCLFPERYRSADVPHSYLVELKYSKADASEEELAAKYREALDQLAKYRADKSVPTLARGTTLHQIVFQFKGSELVRIEQVAEESIP
ncbi:MAG: AAA family ATPase [Kiritimatiellae bacterium]|nr:AAA family ATPase [Kiritimatiellia bacterium]